MCKLLVCHIYEHLIDGVDMNNPTKCFEVQRDVRIPAKKLITEEPRVSVHTLRFFHPGSAHAQLTLGQLTCSGQAQLKLLFHGAFPLALTIRATPLQCLSNDLSLFLKVVTGPLVLI